MARIRSIKPEFPHSESMGNVSRDARLCFMLLWTVADDSGRLRGDSRLLASLLFPYDDDARALIPGWLEELEREGCVIRYENSGASYLAVTNWGLHQKIDKPTGSKLPPPPSDSPTCREDSRGFASDSRDVVGGMEGNGNGKGMGEEFLTGNDEIVAEATVPVLEVVEGVPETPEPADETGQDAQPPPGKPPRDPSEPWKSVSECLNLANAELGVPPPTNEQVKRHLADSSHLRKVMNKHGPELSARMFAFASKTFKGAVTWTTVWNCEADILSKMRNGKSSLADDHRKIMAQLGNQHGI